MQTEQKPLILTLKLDPGSQAFFERQRRQFFPPERNYLNAHLTLFHQLPNRPDTFRYLEEVEQEVFEMTVSGLCNLSGGVAYEIDSRGLQLIHHNLSTYFNSDLIPQDKQGFKPHIVIQNKVSPEESKQLMEKLKGAFSPFSVSAIGLDLWTYQGGPWQHNFSYHF